MLPLDAVRISIHAPLRERLSLKFNVCFSRHFNPRSLTGATLHFCFTLRQNFYFNPRSLTGATTVTKIVEAKKNISIHAPLRERRTAVSACACRVNYFNPRSLTGATAISKRRLMVLFISIHAPLRERRCAKKSTAFPLRHFNPRSLTGATLCNYRPAYQRRYFNPRSLTGATVLAKVIIDKVFISIHAPLRERP